MAIQGRTVRRCRMQMNLSRIRRLATCAVVVVATAACGGRQQPHRAVTAAADSECRGHLSWTADDHRLA